METLKKRQEEEGEGGGGHWGLGCGVYSDSVHFLGTGGKWLVDGGWRRRGSGAGLVGLASATEFVGDDTPMARFGAVRRRRVDPVRRRSLR